MNCDPWAIISPKVTYTKLDFHDWEVVVGNFLLIASPRADPEYLTIVYNGVVVSMYIHSSCNENK